MPRGFREDMAAWYKSVEKQKPRPGLPETYMLQGLGITAKVRPVGTVLVLLGWTARVLGPCRHMGGRVGRRLGRRFVFPRPEFISSCSQPPRLFERMAIGKVE